MKDYHAMNIAEKTTYAREHVREAGVRCPRCEAETPWQDLLAHIAKRCTGPREPSKAARWLSWPEVRALGVSRGTLHRFVVFGVVRARGEALARDDRKRRYLARDVVLVLAWRAHLSRAGAPPRAGASSQRDPNNSNAAAMSEDVSTQDGEL